MLKKEVKGWAVIWRVDAYYGGGSCVKILPEDSWIPKDPDTWEMRTNFPATFSLRSEAQRYINYIKSRPGITEKQKNALKIIRVNCSIEPA